jgi:AraC-like DNA-binding protein
VVALIDERGSVVGGSLLCPECVRNPESCLALAREALRWGEPAISECAHNYYLWAVPVTDNNRLIGGILAGTHSPDSSAGVQGIHHAARYLLQVAIAANLINETLFEANAIRAAREASRAMAIHSLKDEMYTSVREVYLREEAGLIGAIKTGDKGLAREILNRILVGIYALGQQDFELLKALVLELVVVIYRTAVEAGGDPVELLGLNYASFRDLAGITSEEELSQWLVQHLERFMDSIFQRGTRPVEAQLQVALHYMQEHFTDDITREDVAKACLLSPSHLSHMLRAKLNKSYVEILNELRLSRSRELLLRSEKSLAEVALGAGFTDQSYFTKVFRKHMGCTPKEYRTRRGGPKDA